MGTKFYFILFQVPNKKNRWILDSGCSKHMTGNPNLLSSIKFKRGGTIMFGDNNKGQVIRIGIVSINSKPIIDNVLLVENLKYNLLSISQLCDKNYKIVFEKDSCMIYDSNMSSLLFKGFRKKKKYIYYQWKRYYMNIVLLCLVMIYYYGIEYVVMSTLKIFHVYLRII